MKGPMQGHTIRILNIFVHCDFCATKFASDHIYDKHHQVKRHLLPFCCSCIVVSTCISLLFYDSLSCTYGSMHHNDLCMPLAVTEQFPVVSVALATILALLVQ